VNRPTLNPLLLKLLPTASLFLVAGVAQAQVPNVTKFRLTVGYGFGNKFDDKNGDSVSLQGPVIGVEVPIVSSFKFDTSVSASWFAGGRLRKGSDPDADVWRFAALARTPIPGTPLFAKGGIGYAFQSGRGQVGDEKGATFQIGVVIPLTSGYTQRVVPTVDAYYVAGKGGRGGFVVGATFSF